MNMACAISSPEEIILVWEICHNAIQKAILVHVKFSSLLFDFIVSLNQKMTTIVMYILDIVRQISHTILFLISCYEAPVTVSF